MPRIPGSPDGVRARGPIATPRAYHSAACATLKALAALAMAGSLSACSIATKTAGLGGKEEMITASVTKPVKSEGIDGTDAEVIKNAVAQADKAPDASNLLAWSNPDTGNSGTITAIDRFVGSHGQKCKKFETTVDTFMGISLYDGETCELKPGFWVLSWFIRKDK
jgi:surface antigen